MLITAPEIADLGQCFVIVGATLQCSAYTVPHLIVGRVITGFGTGIDSSTVPMYQSELCRKEKRGRLVSWEVFFIGVGIVFAYWLDFGMSYAGGAIAWRLPIAVQLVFAITVIVLLFGLPESPRSVSDQAESLLRLTSPDGFSSAAAMKKRFRCFARSSTCPGMIHTLRPK